MPGALEGDSGTIVAPERPLAQEGDQKTAKGYSVFGTKMETWSNFSWVCFVVFLEVRVF